MKHFIYQIGGQVKISDFWYEIQGIDYSQSPCTLKLEIGEDVTWVCETFVQDYEPPEPEEEPVTIFSIKMEVDGLCVATLTNGFQIEFDAADLISLESFK